MEGQEARSESEILQAISSAIAGRAKAADKDLERLDQDLEQQIANLGLFPYEDSALQHFPPELHKFCGCGLGIWQYPNQLLPLVILLHQYRVESYLEIGVAAGGTFNFMCELLSSWAGPGSFRALGCDPAPPGCVSYLSNNPYQMRFREWLQAAGPTIGYEQVFSEFLERQWLRKEMPAQSFDCVFVDGDHSYEGCWADLQMALRLKAGIIILHDVVNIDCPGVCEAWAEAQSSLKNEFDFFEFSAQYENIMRKPGEMFLGIGVCVRKTMPRRSFE
eukprot:TRINITY_DN78700_c0_g1_i1.p1 TRINITY_DN78700_c0_g1~~TRINITY_DN78700_c0_g1_i1.p1  ORF type:complete len:301 (+),score=51.85 TRINITY_DN78700_c0_g1_i1:78-905(+)